jgi:LysR family transcriptional activator of nhaA
VILAVILPRWLERQGKRAHIVGEFDGSALIKVFGEAGAGVFPTPAASMADVTACYQVVSLGETDEIRERFFLISAERRLAHPAERAVSEHARSGLFALAHKPV